MLLAPSDNTLQRVTQIPVPVPYTGDNGLLSAIGSESISASRVAPKMRVISSAQFSTGVYPFPTPSAYTPSPYTLPMLEPRSWEVDGQQMDAFIPVEVYRLGDVEAGDMLSTDFRIRIAVYQFGDENQYVPFQLNQRVRIVVWKNAGIKINWDQSNVENNGMPDSVIEASELLVFDVINREGIYCVSSWIYPNFLLEGFNDLDLGDATTLAEFLTAINNRTTTAGGDLTGDYPNPAVKNKAVTLEKMQDAPPLSFLVNYTAAPTAPQYRSLVDLSTMINIPPNVYDSTSSPTDVEAVVARTKWFGRTVYQQFIKGSFTGGKTINNFFTGSNIQIIDCYGSIKSELSGSTVTSAYPMGATGLGAPVPIVVLAYGLNLTFNTLVGDTPSTTPMAYELCLLYTRD